MSDDRPLIAHILFSLDYGGLENGVVNLVNRAPQQFRHTIIALSGVTEFSRRVDAGISIYAIGKRPGKDFIAYLRLYRLLKRLKPAAVHTRNIGTLDCAVIAFLAGVPVRIHGEHGWDIFDPDGANLKYRLLRRALSRFVRVFVTVSGERQRWLATTVGIPDVKIRRICNGVDTAKYRPAERGDPRPLPADKFAEGAIIIGSVTRFTVIKDPMNLVEAFLRLRRESVEYAASLRLLMVGDGELRETALARLAAEGAADAAWLPGSRDDVPALMRCMDVFVLGSYREGISNTILEAMASGLPVVATNVGGSGELVSDGETGLLVPARDPEALAKAISTYVADPGLRRRHGRRAREKAVADFSLEAMLGKYCDLYERELGAGV